MASHSSPEKQCPHLNLGLGQVEGNNISEREIVSDVLQAERGPITSSESEGKDDDSSTKALDDAQELFLYGMQQEVAPMPRRGAVPKDWEWPDVLLSKLPRPPFDSHVPEPAMTPPDGFTYPQAPEYHLNKEFDARFARGYFLSAPFDSTRSEELKAHLLAIKTPPHVHPYDFNTDTGEWKTRPIPGMINMHPGIPYVHLVDNDPLKPITVGVLHTVKSLRELSPHADRIESSLEFLSETLFGRAPVDNKPELVPLYELEGLKPNDRSTARADGSFDGSYNLASTLVKGQGRGVAAPAITAATRTAVKRISDVTVHVHALFRDIMEVSLAKEELDNIDFQCVVNNVFSFGGIEPGNTGLQMNASTSTDGGELTMSIGETSGSWHLDQSDDPSSWTLFLLFFKLVDGSDHGVFCLARPGLYVRQPGEKVIILIFKGRDLHSGFASSQDKRLRNQWLSELSQQEREFFASRGMCRIGLVAYISEMAATRLGTMSVTPVTGFGNEGAYAAYKRAEASYARQPLPALGTKTVACNRLARESIMQKWNQDQYSGVEGRDPREELRSTSFIDEHGDRVMCQGNILHPIEDAEIIRIGRARFQDHKNISLEYDVLGMRKTTYKAKQASIKQKLNPSLPTQRPPLNLLSSSEDAATGTSLKRKQPTQNDFGSTSDHELTSLPAKKARAASVSELTAMEEDMVNKTNEKEGEDIESGVNLDTPAKENELIGGDGLDAWAQVENEDSEMEGEGEIYDVKGILADEIRNGQIFYFVSWAGYGSKHDSWVARDRISPNNIFLSKYIKHKKEKEKASASFEASKRQPINNRPPPISLSSGNGGYDINQLLCNNRLSEELHHLELSAHHFYKPAGLGALAVSSFCEALSQQEPANTSIMEITPGPWTSNKSLLTFMQLRSSISMLPALLKESAKADIILRSLNWEAARAYLTIYHWYDDAGPSLVDSLCSHYTELGADSLLESHPSAGRLLDHLIHYIGSRHNQIKTYGSQDVEKLPGDLYGLKPGGSGTLRIYGSDNKTSPKGAGGHIAWAASAFLETISREMILPGMRSIDAELASNGRRSNRSRSETEAALKSRLVITGGTISRLVRACEGEDCLLASKFVQDIILYPTTILFNTIGIRDDKLCKQILADPDAVFAYWDDFLRGSIKRNPDAIATASDIADTIWMRLDLQGKSKQSGTCRVKAFFAPLHSGGKQASNGRAVIDSEVSVETLCPDSLPSYAAAALLIREVLAKRRGNSECNEYICRILDGKNPISSSTPNPSSRDIDHFNPVRSDNVNTRQLRTCLPPNSLTAKLGISALLAWMSTGQGGMTASFANGHNMLHGSLAACIATFRNANSQGIDVSNTKIWGKSPCSWMLISGAKFSIEEKFRPMYDYSLQQSWVDLLGDLANNDPTTYTGNRIPWWEMLEWLHKQNITLFKNFSLTALQFVNNAALMGLCKEPTSSEMADFLCSMKSKSGDEKGGYKGLELLGFTLSGRASPGPWIRAAFLAFYDHLDTHLSSEDKDELHFGAMFVEHLLCKIARYSGTFKQLARNISLSTLGKEAIWQEGAHDTHIDMKFPIPLGAEVTELKASIMKALQ